MIRHNIIRWQILNLGNKLTTYFTDWVVWHVSNNGTDSSDCSVPNPPCRTVQQALWYSTEYDELQIHTEPGMSNVYELCQPDYEINYNPIYVLGVGHEKPIITCPKSRNDNFLLNVQNFYYDKDVYYFDLENIAFNNGDIVIRDASVRFENCSFENASIYAMLPELHSIYYNESSTANSPWRYFENYVSKITLSEPSSDDMCEWALLVITDSSWSYLDQHLETLILDSPRTDGINIVCVNVELDIFNTIFNNQLLDIITDEPLYMVFTNSIIRGVQNETLIPGGINIIGFTPPAIVIENSSFIDLTYGDMAMGVFAKFVLNSRAALTWTLFYKLEFEEVLMVQPIITISNAKFINNTYAIQIAAHDENANSVTVIIEDSQFLENKGFSDGGAVVLFSQARPTVKIDRCLFTGNAAGVNPFGRSIFNHYPYTVSKRLTIQFLDYLQDNTDTIIFRLLSNKTGPFNFKYKIIGGGGALHISGVMVNITNTVFINNTASGEGGSILATKEAWVYVSNVDISISESQKTSSSHGDAIYSQAYLTLVNISMRVYSASVNSPSVLYHQNSADWDTLKIDGIDLMCPSNVRLSIQTSSVAAFRTTPSSLEYFSYRGLIYSCEVCSSGYYTLKTGSLSVKRPEQKSDTNISPNRNSSQLYNVSHLEQMTKQDPEMQDYNYTEISCSTCPFGANCGETIRAKPNYWGIVESDEVKMFRCPLGYCCSQSCYTYNQCAAQRGGTLCGQCLPRYSEAMFSTKCLPSYQCTDKWFLAIILFSIFLYTGFLLFQNDFKLFLLGKPLGKKIFANKIRQIKVAETSDGSNASSSSPEKDEGGVFLILLFYYFQDASIIHFEPIYKANASELEATIRKIVYGLFKFKIDVLHLAKTICIFEHMTPVGKIVLNLATVPLCWITLLIIYVVFRSVERRRSLSPVWFTRCVVALMLSILFSYQKILSAFFDMVYCVHIYDNYVLFLDGTVTCFNVYQWAILIEISFGIVPFAFYLTFAPGLLGQGKISTQQFLVGCMMPLPMSLYILFTRQNKRNPQQGTTSSKALCALLQGPYKPLYFPGTQTSLCWSGVLLYRRLALIIVYTVAHKPLPRLSVMFVICLVAQLAHVAVQPCKEKRANLSGTVSCTALLAVAAINTVKATYEGMEIIPTDLTLSVMNTFENIEDCLLIWIPLAGMCIIFVVLLLRIIVMLWSLCMKHYLPH